MGTLPLAHIRGFSVSALVLLPTSGAEKWSQYGICVYIFRGSVLSDACRNKNAFCSSKMLYPPSLEGPSFYFCTFLHIRLTLSKKQTFPRMSLKVKDVSRPYWISSDTLLGLLNVLYQWPSSLFSALRIWSAFPSELNVEVLHSVSSPVVLIRC